MNKIAMYLRLSIEDGNKGEESNSIVSQRIFIKSYIKQLADLEKHQICEFCDDGYSGTTMDRPGMNQLLNEVKKGQVRCIVVKDMSRFSRDYIDLGTYLNQIFPFMKVRFIAINDNYDSAALESNTMELDTAFKTLLYDLYSKDISSKVKNAFQNKYRKGEYVCGHPPFGYIKHPNMKNEVCINEEEAKVIRYIFDLSISGLTAVEVSQQLHNNQVPTWSQFRNRDIVSSKNSGIWSPNMVRRILNNRFYIGEMAYGKTTREHVGSSKAIYVPEVEWKVIKDHHEPIVAVEAFEQVNLKKTGLSTKRKYKKHPLVGVIECGGCHYSLSYKRNGGKDHDMRSFQCRMHSQLHIKDCCTYINADILEEIVLSELNQKILVSGQLRREKEQLEETQGLIISGLKEKIKASEKLSKQLMNDKDNTYEAYGRREMPVEEYKKKVREIEKKNEDEEASRVCLEQELEKVEDEYYQEKKNMKQIIRFSHVEKLTQEIVDVFIRKIYVYRNKRVEIEWKFSGGQF